MNKMKRKGILKRLAVCSVSLTMLLSATACGKPDNVGGKIAVICKNEKVSFWDEVKKGADDCCDEMGYDMLYYCASSDNDFASQIEYINDAINQGAKAIVIAPNDPNELTEAFDRATAKGIKIVNINSRSNYDNIVSYVGSSDFDGGAVAARNAVQLLFATATEGDAPVGKIAMIGHTASTADLRLTGFRATFTPSLMKYIAKQKADSEQAQAQADSSSGAQGAQGSQGAQGAQGSNSEASKEALMTAAKAAATQASQGGAPDAAILAAAQNAARSVAGEGVSEDDIKAAAEAAVQAVKGGGNPSTEETTQPASGDGNTQGGPPAGAEGSQGGNTPTDEDRQNMIANYFIEGERCGTKEAAYEEAKKILEENSDIKVMFGTNTNTTLGICQAVEELDKANDIIVVGFNSDEQELKYVRTGVLDGTIIQNPYNMGYIGVRYSIQASNGEGVAGSLDTGVTWISAKNINDDDIQLLLYPEKA